jgi:hypothetical protein
MTPCGNINNRWEQLQKGPKGRQKLRLLFFVS